MELTDIIELGSCAPQHPDDICPVQPVYIFQRGGARVAIDSVEPVSAEVARDTLGDPLAFPFFTTAGTTTEDGQ